MKTKTVLNLLILTLVAGCGKIPQADTDFTGTAEREIRAIALPSKQVIKNNDIIKIVDETIIQATPVIVDDNPVDVDVTEVPLALLLKNLAISEGWSLRWVGAIEKELPITVTLSNVGFERAIKDIAGYAGYVVLFDSKTRQITIAERATWTMRFPARLLETLSWTFDVGGNPANIGGGDNSLGSSLNSESSVSGATNNEGELILTFLTDSINSGNTENDIPAKISSASGLGVITVEGNYRQLSLAENLVKKLLEESTTKVELKVAIVEVFLDSTSEIGIDWRKILGSSTDGEQLRLLGREVVSPSFSGSITRESLSFVLEALRQNTDLNVVTRPNLIIDNHTPADLFDGSVLPYLSAVNVDIGESGDRSFSAESDNAADGVKLSVLPHVLSADQLQLKLIPVLSGVSSFETFSYGGGGSLTLPNQQTKQALLSVTLGDGETLILAGNRVSSVSSGRRGLPLLSSDLSDSRWGTSVEKEVAIIINVSILPPPNIPVILDKNL